MRLQGCTLSVDANIPAMNMEITSKYHDAYGARKCSKSAQNCALLEAKGITKLESYTNQRSTQIMSDLDKGTYIHKYTKCINFVYNSKLDTWFGELKININNY